MESASQDSIFRITADGVDKTRFLESVEQLSKELEAKGVSAEISPIFTQKGANGGNQQVELTTSESPNIVQPIFDHWVEDQSDIGLQIQSPLPQSFPDVAQSSQRKKSTTHRASSPII